MAKMARETDTVLPRFRPTKPEIKYLVDSLLLSRADDMPMVPHKHIMKKKALLTRNMAAFLAPETR